MLIGNLIDGNLEHHSKRQKYGDCVVGPWVFKII